MAITDIPEFVEVVPGDLIRAENWNDVQRKTRNTVRRHKHTRAPGVQPNDAGASDDAEQIGTSEIADGAVTAPKLAAGVTATIPDGAVTTPKLGPAAVTGPKLAPSAVAEANIANGAVTVNKIAFATLDEGSNTVGGNQTLEVVVKTVIINKTAIYFPVISLANTPAGGTASIEASIVYRQTSAAGITMDVVIRLVNRGNVSTSVAWHVMTFAN